MKTQITTAEVMGMPGSNINETSCLAQCSIEEELLCTCCAWGSLRHKLGERLLSLLPCAFPWRADEMITFNPLSVWCGGGCHPSKAMMEVVQIHLPKTFKLLQHLRCILWALCCHSSLTSSLFSSMYVNPFPAKPKLANEIFGWKVSDV